MFYLTSKIMREREMFKAGLNVLRRLVSRASVARFPNATIASHSLKTWGRVAGKVDGVEQGWLRGWIYDASRPDDILKLDIFVNGTPAAQTTADQYRDDLAQLLKDNGIHGFEAFLPELSSPGSDDHEVIIRVADRPGYMLGPVRGTPRPSASTDFVRGGLISGNLDDRLRHIFNHITGAHENSLRRFDDIQSALERIIVALERSGKEPDRTLLEQTAISGVGQFRPPLPDAVEQVLLERGIENAIRARRTTLTDHRPCL